MLQFLLLISDESDHEKIKYLYDRYHNEMLKIAKYRLRMMGLPNYEIDAEDAVQNAFLKITRYIKRINFSAPEKEIKAYIMTIIANETINVKADYSYFDDIDNYADTLEDGDFFIHMKISERYNEVVDAIKMLDEKYGITLWYRFKEELSIKDISKLLGISEKTVYTRIERGKKLLLDLLKRGSTL